MAYNTKKDLTIFTPTYNRAHTLPRLYNSLKKQICRNFIWLIIDDGSRDETEKICNSWQIDGKIEIVYHKRINNHGKSSAHNLALSLTKTKLFLNVDSDDYLDKSAVKKLLNIWNKNKNKNLAGVISLKGYTSNKAVGTMMPSKITTSNLYNLYNRYHFIGDACLMFRTDILKRYLFPSFKDEKFIPEAYIYDQIDQKYQMVLFNEILYICEYLNDGYSKNIIKTKLNNPKGFIIFYLQRCELGRYLKTKIKSLALYLISAHLNKEKNIIKKSPCPVLTILSYPLAWFIYFLKYKPILKKHKK